MAFRYDRPHKRHRLTFRMVGIVMLLVGAGAAVFLGMRLVREHRAASWPSVLGRLDKAAVRSIVSTTPRLHNSVSFHADVEYTYIVNGRSYTGHHYYLTTDRIMTSFGAAAATKELVPEKQVPVCYDPDDPSISCLHPQKAPPNMVSLTLSGGVAGAGIGLIILGPRLDARRRWG